MQHARSKPLLRVLTFSALAILLGVVSLALTQCTMIRDNVTGVGLNGSAPTSCIKDCNDQYAALYKIEQKQHIANVAACKAIADNQARNDCLNAESARHSAAMDQLSSDKIACQDGCHRQGVGSAG